MQLNQLNVHPQNAELAAQVCELANQLGYDVRHNKTSYGKFAGWHRYVVLNRAISANISIRSRGMVCYTETPFIREFMPSVVGERRALTELLAKLQQ